MVSMLFKTPVFVKKLKTLCSSGHTILFKFHQHVVQIIFKDYMQKPNRLSMSALARATRKSFNSKFIAKIDFLIRHILCYHCWCWHRKYKVSSYIFFLQVFELHTGEIWAKSYGAKYTIFWAFFNHFWQSVDAILEDVSVTEIIAWCCIIIESPFMKCKKEVKLATYITSSKNFEVNIKDMVN